MSTFTILYKNRLTCERNKVYYEAKSKEEAKSLLFQDLIKNGKDTYDFTITKVLKEKYVS